MKTSISTVSSTFVLATLSATALLGLFAGPPLVQAQTLRIPRDSSFVGNDKKADLMYFNPSEAATYVAPSLGFTFANAQQFIAPGDFGSDKKRFYPGDFNGDGLRDLGYFEASNNSFHVAIAEETSLDEGTFRYAGAWVTPNMFGNGLGQFYIGDFDGDKNEDLGFFEPSDRTFHVALSTKTGFMAGKRWIAPNMFGDNVNNYYPGDFDGDGATDLGFFQTLDNTFHVTLSTKTPGFNKAGSGKWVTSNNFGHGAGTHYVGDFTGDGKDDLGFFEPSDKTFHVNVSTGGGFFGANSGRWIGSNLFGGIKNNFFPGDYDGDGDEDLGFFEPSDSTFWVALSNRQGFVAGTRWIGSHMFGDPSGAHYASRSGRRSIQGSAAAAPLPAMPTNLTWTAKTKTTVKLAWTDNAYNEQEFQIRLSSGRVDVVPANATSFIVDSLTPNTHYCFAVRSLNMSGSSPWSAEICTTTDPGTTTVVPEPTDGTVAASMTLDVGMQPANTCGMTVFELRNEPTLRTSSVAGVKGLRSEQNGVAIHTCRYSTTFFGVAFGSYRVSASSHLSCASATVSATSRNPVVTLQPFVCR